jgi:hypothetical protein
MSDWNPTGIKWNGGGKTGLVEFGTDNNLLVMFYTRSIQNAAASAQAGRPVHEDHIYVKIQQPGEMLNVIDRPVNDGDKQRFKNQWANFLHDRTQVPDGTPIDLLFPNYPAVAENLRGFGVFTIEQCAELSAHAIDNIGRGGQEYVNRAKKFLDMSNKGQAFHQLQRENDDLKQRLKITEQQVVQMKEQLDRLTLSVTDPIRASQSPPYVENYDVQSERINNNAPTKEHAEKIKRSRRAPTPEERVTNPLIDSTEDANA